MKTSSPFFLNLLNKSKIIIPNISSLYEEHQGPIMKHFDQKILVASRK